MAPRQMRSQLRSWIEHAVTVTCDLIEKSVYETDALDPLHTDILTMNYKQKYYATVSICSEQIYSNSLTVTVSS
eukprot:3266410-Amphidinium_carterae.1